MRTSIIRFSVFATGVLVLLGQGCRASAPSTAGPASAKQAVASKLGFGKLPKLAALETAPIAAGAPAPSATSSAGPAGATTEGSAATPVEQPAVPSPTAPVAAGAGGLADQSASAVAPTGAAPTVGTGQSAKAQTAPPKNMPRPLPMPKPRPVTVEYIIEDKLPAWSAAGDVLRVGKTLPDAQIVSGFAKQAGLPAEITNGISTVASLNLQWVDRDGYTWTYDAANRSVSFWKETSFAEERGDGRTALDEQEILKAANDFLDAHGFSAIRGRGAQIQELPQLLPLMQGRADKTGMMPCFMGGVETTGVGTAPSGLKSGAVTPVIQQGSARPATGVPSPKLTAAKPLSARSATKNGQISPDFYPYPCWWPVQATVTYPGEREGRRITDGYGTDVNTTNLAVDLRSKQVVNGFIQLDDGVERSVYPLIDQDAAKRRLQSGGRNPVWPWGSETGNIKVRLKKLELVWMRHDVWQGGLSDTYYLPALRASGTVERGKNVPPEDYRTTVPLLADGVFEDETSDVPPPVPLPLRGEGTTAPRKP